MLRLGLNIIVWGFIALASVSLIGAVAQVAPAATFFGVVLLCAAVLVAVIVRSFSR